VTFRPPADPAAITNFAEKSGLAIPEDLNQELLVADGETRKSAGIIGNWRLLPITEIQAAWGLLTQLTEKGTFAGQEPETPPYIRKAWWHAGWIPVVGSDMGDYFCLDTYPPEPERAEQVLLFLHDRPERPLVAGSLRAWLDRIVRDLDAGVYAYDTEEGFNGEAFMWSALEGKHLLDGGAGKLVV
jgi:cell wall assembly regulator SMI1